MNDRPANSVLEAFDLSADVKPLAGGTGKCWRAGHAVLKPCDDVASWRWQATHFPDVDVDDFRLPLPVMSEDGRWVVDGWCAQQALDGDHPRTGRWADVLAVGNRFHRAIRELARPDFLDARDDPWALGDRVAWGERRAPAGPPELRRVIELRGGLGLPSQIVHGDLTENVLFAAGRPPAVIDFSPYWRPAGFAAAVVVADAVCWREADPDALLEQVADVAEFPQLLVRALVYRMITTIAVSGREPDLRGYAPGIELAVRLVS